MFQTHTLPQKLRQLLFILGPILVTQVALSAINFFDTVMAGRYAPDDLAGVAIGASLWMPVFTGMSGILMALTPIVAQDAGANRHREIPRAVLQGLYLAAALAATVTILGAVLIAPVLATMELETEVGTIARRYLVALSWGILPLFVYTVLRSFVDALGQTGVTMAITLASLPINLILNYALIFGAWGFPRLGGVGAGYASAITYWLTLLMGVWVVLRARPFAQYRLLSQSFALSISAWKEQLRIGLPIGLAIFLEVSIFSAVALLMSRFGTNAIAAHQAAISFVSLLYMVPLSISMALTIAVGFEVGAQRIRDATHYTYLGIGTSVVFSLLFAGGLLTLNRHIAALYTTDLEVLNLVRHFLVHAIFFQLSDAIAAPIQGALRGYKDVTAVLLLALLSYWAIGLPIGYGLAAYTTLGPFGYWIGLIIGLAAGTVGLSWRLRHTQRVYRAKLLGGVLST